MRSTKSAASNMIVPEVLRKDNYEAWKIFMKSYLLGQGLWDVVVENECSAESISPKSKSKKWKETNGKALHAILISCGGEVFSLIKDIESSKDAWEHLASMFDQNFEEKDKFPLEAETNFRRDQSKRSEFPSKGEINFRRDQSRRRGECSFKAATIPIEEADQMVITDPIRRRNIYQSVLLGEWDKTKGLLAEHTSTRTAIVSRNVGTVLHVAVSTGNLEFVENLVESMNPDDINRATESFPNTALNLAAINGLTKIAEALVRKSRDSLQIRDEFGYIPVASASCYGHKDTTRYLYEVTRKEALIEGDGMSGATLLNTAIIYDMYDIVIDLLSQYPQLAVTHDGVGSTTIQVLVTRPDAFPSGLDGRWQQWIYSFSHQFYGMVWNALERLGIKSIHNKKTIHVQAIKVLKYICLELSEMDESKLRALGVYESIFCATKLGIVEIVAELIKINPDLLFSLDEENRNIFSVAVLCRQEKIFNLICGINGSLALLSSFRDIYQNTMLHLAGTSPPLSQRGKMSGAALQMQRELQWFQEVEKITPSPAREYANSRGWKPQELFTAKHKEIVKEGEIWMKDTANSCMVVATLIATFTFAAAFTVPGGNNQDSGFPIFLKHKLFLFFIVSDALSLFSSSTSLLMFLSIHTSHYAEEDFLKSLPKRLIIGLSTLFFSIATMMMAFCATLFLSSVNTISGLPYPLLSLLLFQLHCSSCCNFPFFLIWFFPHMVLDYSRGQKRYWCISLCICSIVTSLK